MALCGTSVRSVHAGNRTNRPTAAAAQNFLFMSELLECDTETSRPRTRTRVVEVVDAAGCNPGQLGMNFRIVTRVRRPQSEIVAGEIDARPSRDTGEGRHVEGVADGDVRQTGERSIFDPA